MPTVYLIHLETKLANHAGHYIGYTALESVNDRFQRHVSGSGARMLLACNQKGITYRVVRVWECKSINEAKSLERKLKHRKKSQDFCPVCNPKVQEVYQGSAK